jgi:hypothetical protein
MDRNISLGSNAVDWVRSLWKIPTWLRGSNFCIICSSSPRFVPSFMQLGNNAKCTQTLWNTPKHEFRVQWGGSGAFVVKKIQCNFVAWTFVLIEPVHYVLKQVSCSYGTSLNAPKYYETHRNISLGSNGVDWVCSLRKILKWLRGTNFCINCSSSPRFAPSFKQLRNDPKCTQTLWNTAKHEWWIRCVRCEKNTMWLRGMNFCINWTSSLCFETSFMQLRNEPKCTQILRNALKH